MRANCRTVETTMNSNQPICKIDEYGTKRWRLNGKLHRVDGPAVELANGDKHWYLNGKLHREDGPAIEYANGSKSWCLNDKLHREDGPAIEDANGDKCWYLNGKLHREDGPAIEDANGDKCWYLNGEQIDVTTQEQFDRLMESRNISEAQRELDEEFPTFECKSIIWSKIVKRIKYELTGNELWWIQ